MGLLGQLAACACVSSRKRPDVVKMAANSKPLSMCLFSRWIGEIYGGGEINSRARQTLRYCSYFADKQRKSRNIEELFFMLPQTGGWLNCNNLYFYFFFPRGKMHEQSAWECVGFGVPMQVWSLSSFEVSRQLLTT